MGSLQFPRKQHCASHALEHAAFLSGLSTYSKSKNTPCAGTTTREFEAGLSLWNSRSTYLLGETQVTFLERPIALSAGKTTPRRPDPIYSKEGITEHLPTLRLEGGKIKLISCQACKPGFSALLALRAESGQPQFESVRFARKSTVTVGVLQYPYRCNAAANLT